MTSEVPIRWVPGHPEPPKRDKTWIAFSCGARWGKKDQAHLASKALKNCAASSEPVDAIQVLHGLHEAVCHALLPSPERHARVVILLVGLLRALWVAALATQLLLDVLLRVVQDHRLELHVARRVHAMHVAEGSSHGELAVGHR